VKYRQALLWTAVGALLLGMGFNAMWALIKIAINMSPVLFQIVLGLVGLALLAKIVQSNVHYGEVQGQEDCGCADCVGTWVDDEDFWADEDQEEGVGFKDAKSPAENP
jgi:hypothetical protein